MGLNDGIDNNGPFASVVHAWRKEEREFRWRVVGVGDLEMEIPKLASYFTKGSRRRADTQVDLLFTS